MTTPARPPGSVLVTGAASGIGRAFARLALSENATVIAVDKDAAGLATLADETKGLGGQVLPRVQDLAAPGAATALWRACEDDGHEIGTLINNAGFGALTDVVDMPPEAIESMIRVNVLALTELSARFGAAMTARRRGWILHVGSIAGMVPARHFTVYGATKAYVNSFSFALRAELRPHGVTVTCLTPGAVATAFARRAGVETFEGRSIVKVLFDHGLVATPERVAAAGWRGLRRDRAHVLAGPGSGLAAAVARLVPASLLPRLM